MLTDGFDPTASPDHDVRSRMRNALDALAEAGPSQLETAIAGVAAPDCLWRAAHPMNEMQGESAALRAIWHPLKQAMPDMERRDLIFMGGRYQGRDMIATMGHYLGTFARDWLGIAPTGRAVFLRYGEVWELGPDGRAIRASLIWDILDLMRQTGTSPLAPSLGVEGQWPGPLSGDGLRMHPSDPDQSRASLEQTLQMHKALAEFDDARQLTREALIDMPQKQHWHPKMMWYGPTGIGTTRTLAGFVEGHQLPFRRAFRRPQGTFQEVTDARARAGAGHYIRLGDGPLSVTAGWPSVYALHEGGGFCAMPPSGRPVWMRVMDFYAHNEGLIRENWVPIDMLHLFDQMGVDLLGRAQCL